MEDFMLLNIPATKEEMLHLATAVMMGIHDMFPKDNNDNNNAMLLKNMKKEESQLSMQKTLLRFKFDGKKKNDVARKQKNQEILLKTLRDWLQSSRRRHVGIPFDEFQLVKSKIRHAFMAIPAGNGLMSPCNSILRLQPCHVSLHNNKDL
jgi:hypothetical protein